MAPERRRDDPHERRRFAVAYGLSVCAHVIVALFLTLRYVLPSPGSVSPEIYDVTQQSRPQRIAQHLRAQVPRPQPTIAPARATAAPTIVPPLVHTPRPRRATRPRVTRAAPRRPELTKIVPHGTPLPQRVAVIAPLATPRPIEPSAAPTTIAATLPPAATPEPASPAPTLPPTPVATVLRTAAPSTQAPAVVPTAAPTERPRVEPTVLPTATATAVPTARPTAIPTQAPTAGPTLASTAPPTKAPTAAPTQASRAKPATPEPASALPAPAPPATAAPTAAAAGTANAKPGANANTAARATAAPGTGKAAGSLAGGPRRAESSSTGVGRVTGAAAAPKGGATLATAGSRGAARAHPVSPSAGRGLDALNSRLNASLPAGDVAYGSREYTNDLLQAISAAKEDYYKAAAPPVDVLARALYVVQQPGGLLGGARKSVLYVLSKRRILGFEICTGWKVENDGSGAIGGYTFGPCGGEQFTPSGGLPTLAPKPAPT